MEKYIVSARKYRPMTFESVVGQRALTDTLRNAIRQNHIAHAYLFCGPRGVGKTTCARIFAKTINCLNPNNNHDACNECESCQAFNEQRSFNIHELDAASNNSVDDIRQLTQEVRIPPQIGKYSVYIIDEVHMLSPGAFNALLKTLEEPPSHAVFILATTEKHKILPTILSRCQVYDFQRITVKDIVEHLQYVARQEGVEAEEEALNVVAQKADGGMRDALSVFDQLVTFCGNNITYLQTIEVLNVLDSEYYFRAVYYALQGQIAETLLLLNEVLQKGFDGGVFVGGLASHLRDLLVVKDPMTVQLLQTSDNIRKQYAEQAAQCPPQWIFRALDLVNTCDLNYRTTRNRRLTVELCLVKLCRIFADAETANVQAPAAAAQPAQATQRTTTQVVPETIPKPQVQTATPPTVRKVPTLNINAAQAPKANPAQTAPQAQAQPTTPQNSPFTIDLLLDAWAGLAAHFQSEERLKALFSENKPTLVDSNTIKIELANPWQKKEFEQHSKQILTLLKQALHNDNILLLTEIQEYDNSSRAYTSSDKYKLMQEKYPVLGELKAALSLQLD